MNGWVGPAMRSLGAFEAAAVGFVDLVAALDGGWDRPGLGVWDLRSLVGHTSRSLVTVMSYLDAPAEVENLTTAAAYVTATTAMAAAHVEAVAERGRQAGRDLGDDPVAAVRQRATAALTKVRSADPEALITTIGGGMRVRNYLPTRTFELVVHGLDIADAAGLDVEIAPIALGEANALAAEAAVRLGHGVALLRGLTGRGPWPHRFVVVS